MKYVELGLAKSVQPNIRLSGQETCITTGHLLKVDLALFDAPSSL